jgi:hypothetical protein
MKTTTMNWKGPLWGVAAILVAAPMDATSGAFQPMGFRLVRDAR